LTEEILPSLYRIVVPLPGSPLKEINSYVLTASDRNLVIDTGMNRPECREAMDRGLEEIGVDLDRTDFIATHLHADHHGLIPSLLRDGRRAYMGETDAEAMKTGVRPWTEGSPMSTYAARSGFPAEELMESMKNHPGFRFGPERVIDYLPLREGDVIDIGEYHFVIVDTPGHTYGHVSLYDANRKLFIAGDHVLGDITPNIQAWSDDQDPLDLYLRSLEKVLGLDVELCLPGHRSLVENFKSRIAELTSHHHDRANEAISILERGQPKTAYDTAGEMTWRIRARSWDEFPLMQRWFATGETIAHLHYLVGKGMVERHSEADQIFYSTGGRQRF